MDDFIYPYEYDHFKAEAAKGKFKLLEPGIGLETAFFWFNENTNVNAKTGTAARGSRKIEMVSQHRNSARRFRMRLTAMPSSNRFIPAAPFRITVL